MSMPRPVLLFALSLSMLSLTACGGGGGGSGNAAPAPLPPAVQNVVLLSSAGDDGYVSRNRSINPGNLVRTGDMNASVNSAGWLRGMLHFDHVGIPRDAIIQSVTLRVHLNVSFGNGIAELGPVVATHVDHGPTLDIGDYFVGSLRFNVGTVTNDHVVGWKDLDVTAEFNADRSLNRGRSQFRLEHLNADGNNDGTDDVMYFEDGDDTGGTGNVPELIIAYTLP